MTPRLSPSFVDLLCAEDAAGVLSDAEDNESSSDLSGLLPGDSAESIAEFVDGEADYSPGFDYSARFRSRSLDPLARHHAVDWILKVHAYFRFQPLTPYLAVNYLDRFLSTHRLPESGWAMQLLSVACLSLAAKMEETLVPSLLDLQVEGARFIFEPRTICKMELLVLTALKWRLRSVTPFTFIHFFAYKADPTGTHTTKLLSRATHIILATILDVGFLDHCPSSMAAAAVICAADCISSDLPLANPVSAMAWCIGLTREGIANCYQLMQQVVISMSSEASSSSSSTSSTPPTKRRKLNTCLWVRVDDDSEGKEAD